jgi:Leucine-rich repeat (LRR) protein
VSHNNITQNISDILAHVPTQLEDFYLSHNSLQGNIPSTLEHLDAIKKLYLDSNRLSGLLPDFSVAFLKVQELDMSNQKQESNQGFVGTIPDSFADLSFLSTLSLASNSLSGTIPPYLADLSRLQNIDLSHNMLTKTIPAVLGKLDGETMIDFGILLTIKSFCRDANNHCFFHICTKVSLRSLICLEINCLDQFLMSCPLLRERWYI